MNIIKLRAHNPTVWFKLFFAALALALLAPDAVAQAAAGSPGIFSQKGKYGLKDAGGKVIVPAIYNGISKEPFGFVLQSDKGVGLCNLAGKLVVPAKYFQVGKPMKNGAVPVRSKKGGKLGLINAEGKLIMPEKYDKFQDDDGFVYFLENGREGYANASGKIIISVSDYDGVYKPAGGMIAVKKNRKYGYINGEGKLVIPIKYDSATNFLDGFGIVTLDGRTLYLDKNGKELPKDKAGAGSATARRSQELVRFFKGGKYGFKDQGGRVVVPAIYDLLGVFSEGRAIAKRGEKWGYIDATGVEVIPLIYQNADHFNEGLAAVVSGGKFGYIDLDGKTAIPFVYKYANGFMDGMARVRDDTMKWGFIDKTGRTLLPFVYEDVGTFSEELAPAKKDGRWGYMDKKGAEIIPFSYYRAGAFSDGLAKVQKEKDGKCGYIDKTGGEIIPFLYEFISDEFSGGLAAVRRDGKWGYINKANEIIIPFEYDRTALIGKAFFRSRDKAVKPAYDRVFPPAEGMFRVVKGKRTGYVNEKGRLVIPCEYEIGGRFNKNGWCAVLADSGLVYLDRNGRKLAGSEVDFSGLPPLSLADLYRIAIMEGDKDIQNMSRRANREAEKDGLWQAAGLVYFNNDYRYGLKDKAGRIVVPAEYEEIFPPEEGMIRVLKNNKTGYINMQGVVVIPAIYESGGDFEDGFCCVTFDGKPRYFDKAGKEMHTKLRIPESEAQRDEWIMREFKRTDRETNLDEVGEFRNGLAYATRGKKCGFIDRWRRAVIPIMYEAASSQGFSEGLAAVKRDGLCGYVDRADDEVIPFEFDDGGDFSDGLAHVLVDDKWGYIDRTGEMVIPAVHAPAWPFRGGLAITLQNGKYGYMDKKGKIALPAIYEDAGHFSEGLAFVKLDGKAGYIDKTGRMTIAAEYQIAREFKDGMALVCKNNRWGYINKAGKAVIPFEYEKLEAFYEDVAMAAKNGKCGSIDREGRIVVPFEYDNTYLCNEDFIAVMKGGKWGFVNKKDRKLDISPRYDAVAGFFTLGLAVVGVNGKGWGYIDRTGAPIVPPVLKAAAPFNADAFARMTEQNGKTSEVYKYWLYKDPVSEYKNDEKYHQDAEGSGK